MALSDFFSGVSNFANNYIAPINNTVSTLYNAFGGGQQGGLLNLGGTLYNNYQNNQAINQAVNAIRDTSNQNLQTLRGVYDQGMQAASPYNQAGASALSGYQNLLQNPASITSNPGYQFRFDQGAEALRRNMAATGFRGSGNELQALHEYGQNFATSELDKSLNRYTPLMNAGVAGLGATADLGRNFAYGTVGVNDTLGSAIAGGALQDARNRTGFMSDLLSGGSQAGGARIPNIPSNPSQTTNTLSNLFGSGNAAANAGAFNGLNAVTGTAAGLGTIGGLGSLAAGTSPAAAAGFSNLLAGTSIGQAAGITGAGALASTGMPLSSIGGTAASNFGANIGSQALGGASGSIGFLPSLGIAAGMIPALKMLSNLSGGAKESAKEGKYLQELERRAQADPTGQGAIQFMSDIAENRQWPNEGNGWVLGNAINRGIISADFPSLHSSQSVVDIWSLNPTDLTHKMYVHEDDDGDKSFKTGTLTGALFGRSAQNTADIGAKALAQTYGLSESQQDQYVALLKNYNDAVASARDDEKFNMMAWIRGDLGDRNNLDVSQYTSRQKAALDNFVNQYMTEPRRKLYAQGLHDQLRSSGYQGDLTKLEAYLRA